MKTKIVALIFTGWCACRSNATGVVSGTVATPTGGALAGITVTLTPSKGIAPSTVVTDADGRFSFAVPAPSGKGTVSVGTLPAPCAAAAPVAYGAVDKNATVKANVTVTCDQPSDPTGLWMGGQYALSALDASGTLQASDICPSPAPTAGAEAFDGNGNLWTQLPNSQINCLIQWSAAQLAAACAQSLQPALTIPFSGSDVYAMAFDAQGTLWVSQDQDARLYGFSADQLTATVSVNPAYTLSADATGALRSPRGLAFDAAGYLWVANGASIMAYAPATLAAAQSGGNFTSPAPDALITTITNQTNTSQASASSTTAYPAIAFNALAFDASGSLWVSAEEMDSATASTDVIWQYAAGDLANAATNHLPAAAFVITRSAAQQKPLARFGALAFDASGNLWLGAAGSGPNLFRYPAANLITGASGADDVQIRAPASSFGVSLAFNPTPPGLPIRAPK